jgi:hypothetical protein
MREWMQYWVDELKMTQAMMDDFMNEFNPANAEYPTTINEFLVLLLDGYL